MVLGEFRVDREGSPVLLNSLMYKMCYYRFGEVMTDYGTPAFSSLYGCIVLFSLVSCLLSVLPFDERTTFGLKTCLFASSADAASRLRASLLPKLIGFLALFSHMHDFRVVGKPTGWDRVRNVEIGNKDFKLESVDEAFTSEHWLVRIFKVKKLENRA